MFKNKHTVKKNPTTVKWTEHLIASLYVSYTLHKNTLHNKIIFFYIQYLKHVIYRFVSKIEKLMRKTKSV